MMKKFRVETDALGAVKVPAEAYAGSFTTRAMEHFKISGMGAPHEFRWALGAVKLAACRTNAGLGLLDKKAAGAMDKAAREFMEGKFDEEFRIDVYQAGAGTPYNMNANEVIANRANELLKAPKGSYKFVHPNDHVNKGQSSNDVIPTATRLAVLWGFKNLLPEVQALRASFEALRKKHARTVKVGRTHLQDAVPVTLGQEFGAYASALGTALITLKEAEVSLRTVGLGGTAIGTGITAHPHFQKKVVKELSTLSGFSLKPAGDLIETTHSHAALLKASSALRALAVEVNRIANDLRLMASGPKAGFNDILLPAVEPGSSIMPGKVNPSIPECVNMICAQVIGLDHGVSLGAQGGQLELNWYTPLLMVNLTHSCTILTNGLALFRRKCVEGISANTTELRATFEGSLVTATALSPRLGYHAVAECVNEALRSKKSLREVVVECRLLSSKEFDRLT